MLAMNYMPENRDRQVMIGCRSDDENRVDVEILPPTQFGLLVQHRVIAQSCVSVRSSEKRNGLRRMPT